jgi:hypothetical protein
LKEEFKKMKEIFGVDKVERGKID